MSKQNQGSSSIVHENLENKGLGRSYTAAPAAIVVSTGRMRPLAAPHGAFSQLITDDIMYVLRGHSGVRVVNLFLFFSC